MSRRVEPSTMQVEPLVPLDDLYLAAAAVTGVPADADMAAVIANSYGVKVLRDHANRLAVSLSDAYRIREMRERAQQELHDVFVAEAREADRLAAWQQARDDFWTHNLPRNARGYPNAGEGMDRINAARLATAEACMADERAAGIPEAVQTRLVWPLHNAALPFDDTRTPYQPPIEER